MRSEAAAVQCRVVVPVLCCCAGAVLCRCRVVVPVLCCCAGAVLSCRCCVVVPGHIFTACQTARQHVAFWPKSAPAEFEFAFEESVDLRSDSPSS